MGTVGDISMQDIARIMQIRQSALLEFDDELVNDEIANDHLIEDRAKGEYYA